jgi:two-component system sensor histidine kinase AlgZ
MLPQRQGNRDHFLLRPASLLYSILSGAALAVIVALTTVNAWSEFVQAFGLSILFIQLSLFLVLGLYWSISQLSPKVGAEAGSFIVVALGICIPGLLTILLEYLVPKPSVEFSPSWALWRHSLIGGLFSFFIVRSVAIQQSLRDRIQADYQVRLDALQQRIRPHFLFNALNTITTLIHDRPDQAESAVLDLADLMRTGIGEAKNHTISDELLFIDRYLNIESLRLTERLKLKINCEEVKGSLHAIPPLLLQPLVENAIIHGISRRTEGGTLRIEGRRIRFNRIRFTVTNPLADPNSRSAKGSNSALDNIRQRLALAYEERYGLKTRIEDGHFIAELTIPVED